jgi:hypothetical protein
MGTICPSARIVDVTTNLTLALANPTQIANGITKLFAESGKPQVRHTLHVEDGPAPPDPGIIPGGIRDRAMRSVL